MKLIVLDMDGVVNSRTLIHKWIDEKLAQFESQNYTIEESRIEVRKLFFKEFNCSKELIFPVLAKMITQIVEATDCKILWSSSWRKLSEYFDIKNAQDMFNRRGLPGDSLIGYTPSFTMYDDGCRGNEIRSWLLNNEFGNIDKCAVIDDRSDAGMNLPKNAKFFQTNDNEGITEKTKDKIIKYLNS